MLSAIIDWSIFFIVFCRMSGNEGMVQASKQYVEAKADLFCEQSGFNIFVSCFRVRKYD